MDTREEAERICNGLEDVCDLNVDFAWAHDETGEGVLRGPSDILVEHRNRGSAS